ncbi:MAG: 16S rRNA (adenine(1518)-N(6)/adenine(1519)-N(6))-dimethyltransferase RsmA [Alphaproteobacteria bacterium]
MPETPDISGLPPLRDVIAAHGLSARKSLGQNFLLDLNITRRIARAVGPLDGKAVLEVGPGPGGLTRALLETEAHRVIAIERDPRCIKALQDLAGLADGRLHIVEQDAMAFDPAPLAAEFGPLVVVANLPYNVATPLLIGWLKRIELFDRMILMFQSEVADRLVAGPGSRTYGRLSVAAQWRCDIKPLFTLPARAFTPPPKVDSTVVEFVPRATPLAEADGNALETVVAAAFSQRRKMLRAALKGTFRDASAVLADAGIDPTARAETIDIKQFCALARIYRAETA